MKKLLLLALTTLLLISGLPANAAVKAGGACKTSGQIKVNGGKEFTCIKKASKLVWSKGLKIVVEATPTATISPTKKLLTPLEKLNADIYQRYVAAEKKVSPNFNFVRCPNVNKEKAVITEKAYIDAYSFWEPIYKSNAKVNWLLMGENDFDCWYETTAKFEGSNPSNGVWNGGLLGHCKVSSTAFCGYGTGVRGDGVFAQYNLIGTNSNSTPLPGIVNHEIVHIYQTLLMSDNYQTNKIGTAACWFIEGQATLFGSAIGDQGNPTHSRNVEIRNLINKWFGVYPKGASYAKEDWLAVLNDLKTNPDFCFKKGLGYSIGWFALEWTYMNYSIEEMHKFLEAITQGSTWENAIQLVLKMDEATYYGNIAQYLADAFSQVDPFVISSGR